MPEILSTITECLEPFPIGWRDAELVRLQTSWTSPSYILLKLVGLLLTGLAVTLGAPFWFDLLSMFVRIRGTGRKPAGRTSAAP